MSGDVKTRVEEGIALLMIDNPPVNALSAAIRTALVEEIKRLDGMPSVKAIILIGLGRTFPAGADIREFGKKTKAPMLTEVVTAIEACDTPVIAAIHGQALGGGYEIALGAHYRIADRKAKIGLPEVTLGLVPGAGGTQRAPRLAGAAVALELMTDGRPLPAPRAVELGLLDGVTDGNLVDAAKVYANYLIEKNAGPRRTRDMTDKLADYAAFQAAVDRFRDKANALPVPAPLRIVECVEAIPLMPFETALNFERGAFEDCEKTPESKALRHAFFAERKAAKFPGLDGAEPREIGRVGIVGGGTMGAGIAIACLDAGLPVTLVEADAETASAARARIDATYERAKKRGINDQAIAARLERLTVSEDLSQLSNADLIIEAIVEEVEPKAQLFQKLGQIAKEGAVLATNTSYLDVNALAMASGRARDVLGLHFFSPANRMKLLEIVVGEATAKDTVATGLALARRLGKMPVRAGVADGFIGNQVLTAYRTAADIMLEEGAGIGAIDGAMRAFGFGLGPYQVLDLAGLDISWARRKRLAATRDPAHRYVEIGDKLCAQGWFGRKAGQGYYRYSEAAPRGEVNPDARALIEAHRRDKGIEPRGFDSDEIRDRCLLAMVAEGARLVEARTAARPSDVDVAMLHGFAFPRWKGGPMHWADAQGLTQVRARLRDLAREVPELYEPSPLFDQAIKNGKRLSNL